jgi:hypothetical protein
LIPTCRCPYCQSTFQPSPYRLQQRVCSQPECQRRRRADYHRQKIRTDPLYAQVVRDSRMQWQAEHAAYQRTYWQTHPEAAERNRTRQRQRDRQRRVTNLVKNNVALDLTSQGFALISLRDMEVRSQESEVRMAAVYAHRSLLTSSNAAERA